MSHNLLKGKRGIVFGALNNMSIAWKVAERAVEEGAIITLSNTPLAVRMGTTQELADKLNAARIQHIGKLLVFWRPMPEKERVLDEDRKPGPKQVKVLKYSKRGGQRPEVRHLRVLGNERLTAGGKVRKAKPKQKSVKKRNLD